MAEIIYVVHKGEYSDRSCMGVFSTREKAEVYVAGDPDFDIEEMASRAEKSPQ